VAAVAAAESGTTIPLARQGCVTGVVIVIIMVLVTASAYVAEAVPGHVVAVATVVTGAAPPIANIAANAANATNATNAAATDAAAVYDVEHSTARVVAIR
jgi:hypothetical protein